MNRLTPLIVRQVGPHARAIAWEKPAPAVDAGKALEDLKLFAAGWVGGLVFFGTLFG
ncbi:hypothetical protein [Sphingosinicella sp. LY1275]|uniref:hypothetical protein n=1 Tax=Sphingosinicella sp. LY1275 TaxID=3095379 RepID=UPI002ADEC456|nr:hypothetical protein [Sphingosinicella sp. LY1275]MEA1014654.1 hypothetical protein [Sphingosinicella sp. LY1275]